MAKLPTAYYQVECFSQNIFAGINTKFWYTTQERYHLNFMIHPHSTHNTFRIWIDADACPKVIKEIVFKASLRLQIPVTLVANKSLALPVVRALISLIKVPQGDDQADQYICENVQPGDLVVTADVPLAALIVEKGAVAINPRGEVYTEANVREHLSYRGFMQGLRSSGLNTGGPPAFSAKDKELFANGLNRYLTKRVG